MATPEEVPELPDDHPDVVNPPPRWCPDARWHVGGVQFGIDLMWGSCCSESVCCEHLCWCMPTTEEQFAATERARQRVYEIETRYNDAHQVAAEDADEPLPGLDVLD